MKLLPPLPIPPLLAVPVHVELAGSPALAGTHGFTVAALSAARLTQLADAAGVAPRVLSLSVSPLHQLPTLAEQLPAFTALESLDLSLGKLLGSVEAVWGLPRLTHLSFDGTLTSGSWRGLRRLSQLRSIGPLLNSDHTAVAAALPSLPGLTRLEVARALPGTGGNCNWSGVRALSQLQTLVLNCARGAHVLQHLPPASLRHLTLITNDLAAIPAHLSRCTHLESLELKHNHALPLSLPWANLPPSCFSHLAPLAHLRSLGLADYHLFPPLVPEALSALSSLTLLLLEGVNVAGGWQHLQGLPLQHMYFERVPLPHFPALPTLTSLILTKPTNLPHPTDVQLYHCLAPQTQLKWLSLDTCRLSAVPPVLTLLTQLTRLDLSDNPITGGLEHLDALALHHLKIYYFEESEDDDIDDGHASESDGEDEA